MNDRQTQNTAPTADRPPPTVARAPHSPWALVIALGIGVFVGGFDQTFVVPVLATIISDLNIPVSEYGQAAWIINGYLLGYTVAMPLMGRLADVYGQLRIFVIGLLIFMGGSVLVAVAPNLPLLAVARAVTALGGGALVPVALAIAADVLPRERRPLGLSSVSVLDDASSLMGPLWGTLIGVWLGWRGLFWMNIVLGVPVLLAVLLLARGRRFPRAAGERVDWPGGITLAAALACLTFALADAGGEPRPILLTLGLYAAALVLFVLFTLRELRTQTPLIDLRIFRNRRIAVANAVFFLEGAALITALVNVPLMTEVLWNRSGAQPGLMLMRMVLFMIIGGVLGGLLAPRIGYRLTASAGFALTSAGLFGMFLWSQDPGEAARWAALAVAGLGFTLADAPIYATVIEAVEATRRASVTALLQVLQTMGMVVGLALLASQGLGRFGRRSAELFEESIQKADPSTGVGMSQELFQERQKVIIHESFDETFLLAAALMAVAAGLSLLLGRRRVLRTEDSGLNESAPAAEGAG